MSLEELISQELGYAGARVIGAGAVSEALSGQLDGQPVIIKVLGRQHSRDSLEAQGLANEPKVLRRLNEAEDPTYRNLPDARSRLAWAQRTARQRVIVALLDSGETASLGTWVVQEFAPDEFIPNPVTGLASELPTLRVMRRVAQALALAHKNDYALCDFEPHDKGDRIRVRWHEDSDEPEVRLIDWNVTTGPEDFPKDLFYFGGHLYRLLLGELVPLDGDSAPPHTLGLGVERWKLLSEGARLLLSRLLHRDPARRYRSAQELAEDLDWHVRSVEIALRPNPIEKIRERANMALTQGRYDRLLAITSLGLSLDPPNDIRQMLGKLNEDARNELEKELRVALAMISVSIASRNYRQAIAEAHQELLHLDERSELARRVRYLELQAKVGQAFRSTGQGDVSEASAWAAIERGMKYVGRAWEDAEREFHQAEALAPRLRTLPDWPALRDLPEAWLSFERAAKLRAQAQPGPNAEKAEAWGLREQERLELLGQAVAACERAIQLAAKELAFHDGAAVYRRELERRETLLAQLSAADEALGAKEYGRALELIQAVQHADPANARAAFLLPAAERRNRFVAAQKAGSEALVLGNYAEAVRILAETAAPDLDDDTTRMLRAQAEAGAAVAGSLDELLADAAATQERDLVAAWLKVDKAEEAGAAPLAALGRDLGVFEASTTLSVHESKFQTSDALKARIAQARQAITAVTKNRNKDTLDDIERLWQAGKFVKAAELAEGALQTSPPVDPGGTERLTGWLDRLRAGAGQGDALARMVGMLEGAQYERGRDDVRAQLAGVLATLTAAGDAKLNSQAILPDHLRDDVAALSQTLNETLKPDGQPVIMPVLFSPAWAAITQSDVRTLLTERAGTYVSASAQAAQSRGDYAEAERWWTRLEKLRSLQANESAARAVGLTRLSDLDQVKRHLERAVSLVSATPPQCAEIHRLLFDAVQILDRGGQNSGAAELRLQMGKLWLATIKLTGTPQEGLGYAAQAQPLLHDAQLDQQIESALVLLQTGIQAEADEKRLIELLSATPGAEVTRLLADLHVRLTKLHGPDSWKALQEWAIALQKRIISALSGWVGNVQRQVTDALGKKDFAAAAVLASQVESETWASRWRGPLSTELTQLATDASQAQGIVAARQALAEAQDALSRDAAALLGTAQGGALIARLQPSTQADTHWTQGHDLLIYGQALAEALAEPGPQEKGYAAAIDRRLVLSRREVAVPPDGDWDAWVGRVKDLQAEVEQSAPKLAEGLATALRNEAGAVPGRKPFNVTRLLELYWEARWARAALRGQGNAVTSLEVALTAATGIFPAVVDGPLVRMLVGLDPDDLIPGKWDEARALVAQLREWRRGLTERPSFVKLPEMLGKDDYSPALSSSIEELESLAAELSEDRQPLARRNALDAFQHDYSRAHPVVGAPAQLAAPQIGVKNVPPPASPQTEAEPSEARMSPAAPQEAEKSRPQNTSGGWLARLFKPAQPKPERQPTPRSQRPKPAHTDRPEPSGEMNDGDK